MKESEQTGHLKKRQGRRPTSAPDWRPRFLEALAGTANVAEACAAAAVGRSTAYSERKKNEPFRLTWESNVEVACDSLEREAWRRAAEGIAEPVFHRGELCGTIRRYSDLLLIFLLKGHRPEKYRDTFRHEIAGPGGGSIDVRVAARETLENSLARIAEAEAAAGRRYADA